VRKAHSREFSKLEKAINRKLREVDPHYGIKNLYKTSRGRYRFEMTVSVDPRDEPKRQQIVRQILRELPGDRAVQAKYYLPESIVERVKTEAGKKGVSQSALVAECLAEKL
jgi:ribosome-binding protein aMBF1 (putative translation factor)